MAGFAEHPHMIFVDGENFTLRGQDYAKKTGLALTEGEYWRRDTFLWFPGIHAERPVFDPGTWWAERQGVDIQAQRAYYFTAVTGDERKLQRTRLAIRDLGFEPRVFKKAKGTKSKGVDIDLATAVVSHAYRGSYEVAYLIAGDGDYVPMVEEAKNAGKRVVVAFFEKHGLNPALRIAADHFIDLSKNFTQWWEMAEKEASKRAAEAAT